MHRRKNSRRLPDICKNTKQMIIKYSLLTFFHLCLLSVLFSAPSLTEVKFQKKLSRVFAVLRGFLNHLVNKRRARLLCCRRTLLARGRTCFAVVTRVTTFATHSYTHVATSDFETELLSRLLLTGAHL